MKNDDQVAVCPECGARIIVADGEGMPSFCSGCGRRLRGNQDERPHHARSRQGRDPRGGPSVMDGKEKDPEREREDLALRIMARMVGWDDEEEIPCEDEWEDQEDDSGVYDEEEGDESQDDFDGDWGEDSDGGGDDLFADDGYGDDSGGEAGDESGGNDGGESGWGGNEAYMW